MDFDDLFDNNERHHKNGHRENEHSNKYRHSDYQRYGSERHSTFHDQNQAIYLKTIIDKIKNNPKLKLLVGLALGVLLLIILVLLIIFLPLIGKLVKYIGENGVQGLADQVLLFLNKLWSGSKAT